MKTVTLYNTVRTGLLFLLLSPSFTSFGQLITKTRKVVPVMTTQIFYLNGGTRATFGGKSRVAFPIHLPPNTIEWYYTFTTTKGQTEGGALNLVPQLTQLMDPSGLSGIAVSSLLAPTGAMVCDIYLTDRKNIEGFMEKADNWGGSFSYIRSGSRENYRSGSVQITDARTGTMYLGFKNPSASEGITVSFEAAAIVEVTEVNKSQWADDTKQQIFYSLIQ